jgi:putative component of membrane protein insertase Oxa1/YidC/SpoIIIJ protein YidD
MKYVGIAIILFYQKFLRGFLSILGFGSECCFVPSCSEYTKEAFIKYGLFKGFYLSIKRVSRCSFCTSYKHDPLP